MAADHMNGVDILVSCGGGDPMPQLLHKIPTAELMPTINMIVASIIHPARAVLPHMTRRKHGSIICLASDAAKIATPGETVIGAAMTAIVMFCRGMANEVKRHNIRVNCLTPSVVKGTPPLWQADGGRIRQQDFQQGRDNGRTRRGFSRRFSIDDRLSGQSIGGQNHRPDN